MESSSLDRPTLSGALDRPLLSVLRINGWKIILLLLVVLLVFTRLYDLGNRAYCHDESTHAWEPWKLITGQGYRFDPVYHGPFLYHATALVYWLFGDSDTTARIASALLAILSVLLVWPLRKWLGKAGALFTMFLLTLSPSMMFRGRFIRHDIFVIAPTMAVVVSFFHYVTDRPTGRPRSARSSATASITCISRTPTSSAVAAGSSPTWETVISTTACS